MRNLLKRHQPSTCNLPKRNQPSMRNPPKQHQPPMCNPPKRDQLSARNHPNETVGAAPVCPPERPRSSVSIPKIHAWCAGNERWMRPCWATRAGTQAPPLPISIIFFHASHTNKITIYTQSTQTTPTVPCAIHPNATNLPARNPQPKP